MATGRDRVVDRDKGYKRIRDNLRKLDKASTGDGPGVFVGVRSDAGDDEDGTPLTAIAAVNEFGSADGHVPERSFLRSTVDANREAYVALLGKALDRAYSGGGSPKATLKRLLGRLGAKAAGDVQKTITKLDSPPNAPATVAKKGSDNPLIDTGRLRQSIDWKVTGL